MSIEEQRFMDRNEPVAFTAASLMDSLAEVSGTPVEKIAPDLKGWSKSDLSPVDEILIEARSSEKRLEENIQMAFGLFQKIAEIYRDPEYSYDSLRIAFPKLLDDLPIDSSSELIEAVLDDPGALLEGSVSVFDNPRGKYDDFARIRTLSQGMVMGIMFSVLLRKLPEAAEGVIPENLVFTLPNELEGKIDYFGFEYSGNRSVTVIGNPGKDIGKYMSGGSLTVITEKCGGTSQMDVDSIGQGMTGGKLRIEGDAAWSVGLSMTGGKLEVTGDVVASVGDHMRGGFIEVLGDVGSLEENNKAIGRVGSGMRAGTIIIGGNVYGRVFSEPSTDRSLFVMGSVVNPV
jgi:hypothetical protein